MLPTGIFGVALAALYVSPAYLLASQDQAAAAPGTSLLNFSSSPAVCQD
jgi:hypothetical protein